MYNYWATLFSRPYTRYHWLLSTTFNFTFRHTPLGWIKLPKNGMRFRFPIPFLEAESGTVASGLTINRAASKATSGRLCTGLYVFISLRQCFC